MGNNNGVSSVFNLSQQEQDQLIQLLAKAKGATPAPAPLPEEPKVAVWSSPQEAIQGILALNVPSKQLGRKGILGWATAECRGGCGGYGGKFCPRCGSRKTDGSISVSRQRREAKLSNEQLFQAWLAAQPKK